MLIQTNLLCFQRGQLSKALIQAIPNGFSVSNGPKLMNSCLYQAPTITKSSYGTTEGKIISFIKNYFLIHYFEHF